MSVFPKLHTIKVSDIGGDSYRDENGNWVTPEQLSFTYPAYAEANGTDDKTVNQDGVLVGFAWTIYVDNSIHKVPYGATVEIYTKEGEVIGNGDVKRFDKGFLGARIWV